MLMKFKCKRKELKSNIIIVSEATQKHMESILMLDFSYYTSIYAIKLQRRPWEGKEDVKNRRDKEAQFPCAHYWWQERDQQEVSKGQTGST